MQAKAGWLAADYGCFSCLIRFLFEMVQGVIKCLISPGLVIFVISVVVNLLQ
jgi:hypothetical protein